MRPPPAASALQPSLFPILSVLVCLLGTLILMMGTVTSFALGPGRTVAINITAPSGERRRAPTYLEWDGTALTVHPARARVALDLDRTELSQTEIRQIIDAHSGSDRIMDFYWRAVDEKFGAQLAGTPMEAVLDETAADEAGSYVVVFVRPSGFESFMRVRNYLMRRHVDIGYEPIEQSYRLRVK